MSVINDYLKKHGIDRTLTGNGFLLFASWAGPKNGLSLYYARWLGEFDGNMSADRGGELLEMYKLTASGQAEFKEGWNMAQKLFKQGKLPGLEKKA